jgi:hypothetical protein
LSHSALVPRSLVSGSTTAPVRKGADNEQAAMFIGWLCLGADPPWVPAREKAKRSAPDSVLQAAPDCKEAHFLKGVRANS